jgi:hypothetical protein
VGEDDEDGGDDDDGQDQLDDDVHGSSSFLSAAMTIWFIGIPASKAVRRSWS